ncbi:hypothetical protein EYZ11_007166 [Aspergillus tanneri]|uniref:Major facilitator superfamily (MFS) profile domain-containing protein n=1 Tax=Aspergillus tanneri TaxID=1220188 RepID=A0A4V3UP22_9EURO|nr:hypothetical protein EYZ11_007166 [Aspergillus tanneri]
MSETSVTDTEMQFRMTATGWTDSPESSRGLEVHPDEDRRHGNAASRNQPGKSASDRIQPLTLESSARPPRDIHGIKWVFAVTAILSSVFLFALDQTIVADVQPNIIAEFGSINKLPWLSVSFLLGTASTNLLCDVRDRFDRLRGRAQHECTHYRTYSGRPGRRRNVLGRDDDVVPVHDASGTTKYIGIIGVVFGFGTVLGPVIGGAFASNASATWRWAFYINLCIGGAFAPAYFFLLPSRDLRPGVTFWDRMKVVDWIGNTLVIGVYVSGLMAISFGGTTFAWNSAQEIAMFCVSGVLLIALCIHQVWSDPKNRMFPVHFLKNGGLLIQFLVGSSAGTSSFVTIYFIPLYFQFVQHSDSLLAGVRLLPFIGCLAVFTMLNGHLMA